MKMERLVSGSCSGAFKSRSARALYEDTARSCPFQNRDLNQSLSITRVGYRSIAHIAH